MDNTAQAKNFVPGKSSMICSKHFNEADLMRKKLMPDTKVVVRLKPSVFPTIFTAAKVFTISLQPLKIQKEEKEYREKGIKKPFRNY